MNKFHSVFWLDLINKSCAVFVRELDIVQEIGAVFFSESEHCAKILCSIIQRNLDIVQKFCAVLIREIWTLCKKCVRYYLDKSRHCAKNVCSILQRNLDFVENTYILSNLVTIFYFSVLSQRCMKNKMGDFCGCRFIQMKN